MKKEYIIKTYNKGKKSFYLRSILTALATSILTMLSISIIIYFNEGFLNFNFLNVSIIFIPILVFLCILFIPDKWNKVIKEYNKIEKKKSVLESYCTDKE